MFGKGNQNTAVVRRSWFFGRISVLVAFSLIKRGEMRGGLESSQQTFCLKL